MPRRLRVLALVLLAAVARAGEELDFQRQVRPILAANCFACHGPDAKERKAGLRLDSADALRVLP